MDDSPSPEDVVASLRRSHFVKVLKLAAWMLRDWHLAEECVADGFVAVYIASTQEKLGSPAGYLVTAVRNSAINKLRTQRRRGELPDAEIERRLSSRPDDERSDPVWSAEAEDQAQHVRREIGRLSERQREVIVLTYYAALSVEETAAVLGIAVGTVKSTASDARRQLKVRLEHLR